MKYIKKNYAYILSFLIPIIILSLVYLQLDCFFFQEKSILVGDAKSQYLSLLSYLKDVFLDNQSLIYSFSKGFGGGMFGTYAYYLSSPINWLIILISKTNLENFFLFTVLLRCGLSGLTMYHYLYKHKLTILLSTCYALNAFFINYYFNIMWMDALWILPLIMLGLDRIVSKKSEFLYFFTLFFAIFSNFYTGFMLCIFSVIYFHYKLVISYDIKKDFTVIKKISVRFWISSLLSGLLCAFMLIPTLYELIFTNHGYASESNFLSPFIFISKFFFGTNTMTDAFSNSNLNIYSGFIIIILVYFYFRLRKIPFKEKIATFVVILLFFLSFTFPFLSYIWHGFSFPNGYVYRFSFIFIGFLVLIASRTLMYLQDVEKKEYIRILLLLILICSILYLLKNTDIGFVSFLGTLIFSGVAIFLLWKYNHSLRNSKNFFMFLVFTVLLELFCNTFALSGHYFVDKKNDWSKTFQNYADNVGKYLSSSTEFSRVHLDNKFSILEGFLFGYYDSSVFLSTNEKEVIDFSKSLGIEVRKLSYLYDSDLSMIVDSLLGIRYIFSNHELFKQYEVVDKFYYNEEIKVYLNNYALSLGYMINNHDDIYGDDVFDYQNSLLNKMCGSDEVFFEKIEYSLNSDKYLIKTNGQPLYFAFKVKNSGDVLININGKEFYNNKVFGQYVTSLKNENGIYEISFESDNLEYDSIVFYTMNEEKVINGLKYLKDNELELEKIDNGILQGKVFVNDDKKTLFLSIPYDENWKILVDGQEYDYFKIYDAFIGINLLEGSHTIEMVYENNELTIGLIISGVTLIGVIGYFKYRKQGII